MKGYMYILECSDGSFYTGSTNNLELRLKQHEAGEGSNHTKKYLPVKLVYYEEFERIDSAFFREKQVQGWNRKKKEVLIAGFWEKLPELSLAYRDLLNVTLADTEALEVEATKKENSNYHVASRASATVSAETTVDEKMNQQQKKTLGNYAASVTEALEVTNTNQSHVIIISNPTPIENETTIVNQLFENGLELFHVRKYDYSKSEVEEYINNVNKKYHSRLVLNNHHELANQFNIKRLHFSERDRLSKTENDFKQLVEDGFILSTSVHSVEEFNILSSYFSYAFLSPVFDSISKTDYKAKTFDLSKIVSEADTEALEVEAPNTNNHVASRASATVDVEISSKKIKLIALGGITPENYKIALKMGFDGVALMGSIWQSENKVEVFRGIIELKNN